MNDRRNRFDIVHSFLEEKGVLTETLLDEIMEKRNGRTVYRCMEDLIEEGRFDSFSECSQEALNLIFDGINYQMLSVWPVDLWAQMIFEYKEVKNHLAIYIEKYLLLHPNIANANKSNAIKMEFKNAVSGVDFEKVLKKLYEAYGYKVEETKATGDQGADLILENDNEKTVVQAKYYSSVVGNSAVQEVAAALAFYKADKGVVVTNSTFTKSASELANANNIELIDGRKLQNMINNIG